MVKTFARHIQKDLQGAVTFRDVAFSIFRELNLYDVFVESVVLYFSKESLPVKNFLS